MDRSHDILHFSAGKVWSISIGRSSKSSSKFAQKKHVFDIIFIQKAVTFFVQNPLKKYTLKVSIESIIHLFQKYVTIILERVGSISVRKVRYDFDEDPASDVHKSLPQCGPTASNTTISQLPNNQNDILSGCYSLYPRCYNLYPCCYRYDPLRKLLDLLSRYDPPRSYWICCPDTLIQKLLDLLSRYDPLRKLLDLFSIFVKIDSIKLHLLKKRKIDCFDESWKVIFPKHIFCVRSAFATRKNATIQNPP